MWTERGAASSTRRQSAWRRAKVAGSRSTCTPMRAIEALLAWSRMRAGREPREAEWTCRDEDESSYSCARAL